jgi:peptidoglycan/LPS O-acetylase OafA/YrhL
MLLQFAKLRNWIRERHQILSKGVTLQDGLLRKKDNFLVLRIIAASLVIYGHAPHLAPAVSNVDIFVRMGWGHYSGDIAVDAFFLISGFLVTGSYIRQNDLYKFAKARFLRVFPAFLLNVSVLALVYGAIFTTYSLGEYYRSSGTWDYILVNLKYSSNMVWSLPGVFDHGMKASTINGSQWTLPAEIRMYVLLGVLGGAGVLFSKRFASFLLIALVILAQFHPEFFPLNPDWFRPGGFFLLGVLCYLHKDNISLRLDLVVALVLLAVLTHHLSTYALTFPLALAAVVFFMAYRLQPLTILDRYGDPSYGIYLWGWPAQQVVAYLVPSANIAIHTLLALLIAISAGYASWNFFERHMLRFK